MKWDTRRPQNQWVDYTGFVHNTRLPELWVGLLLYFALVLLCGLVQGDKTRVAGCKYYIYSVRRESHVTLEGTSSDKWHLCHPVHRCKPTDFRSAMFASWVYSANKTNRTNALLTTGRTVSSSPGLMISTAWAYNTTDVIVPITARQQNLEMCATVPPFCGVAPLSTGGQAIGPSQSNDVERVYRYLALAFWGRVNCG